MKAFLLITVSALAILGHAAPNFVTPAMIRRNGLTDDQYSLLWSQGKQPTIDIGAARDWVFRASRYQNVTNWLDICGETNNFAALSYDLQGKNFVLADTNKVLVATNRTLEAKCETLAGVINRQYTALTNEMAKCSSLSNLLVIVSAQAEAANAKIQDEIADLEAKVAKYQEYQTKYPIFKTLWTALINDAQNRIKILQALTGGAE